MKFSSPRLYAYSKTLKAKASLRVASPQRQTWKRRESKQAWIPFFTRSRVIKSSDGTLRKERLITEKVEFQTIDPAMLTVPLKGFLVVFVDVVIFLATREHLKHTP